MLLLGAFGDGGSDGLSGAETEVGQVVDVGLVDGYEASVLLDGLIGPTQIAQGPDGDLLVAQLDGDEESGTGQVLRIDPEKPGDRTVLFDGLRKPTEVTTPPAASLPSPRSGRSGRTQAASWASARAIRSGSVQLRANAARRRSMSRPSTTRAIRSPTGASHAGRMVNV